MGMINIKKMTILCRSYQNKAMAVLMYGVLSLGIGLSASQGELMAKEPKPSSVPMPASSQTFKGTGIAHHCPRIIQQPVHGVLVNIDNTLRAPYCDYYIFPKPRQKIEVTLRGVNLSMQLVKPEVHDFSKGAYHTKAVGRHVLRVSYNGMEAQPKNIVYSFTLKIQ